MNYYIKADRYLLENGEKTGGYLEIVNDRFGSFVNTVPVSANVIDWSGYTIAPGLFDTHIHGANGYDIMDGTEEAVNEISKAILPLGVTRFLPTTLTSSKTDLDTAIKAIRSATVQGLSGAKSEGIFLEGPYFTEKHKGAQNPDYFRDPDYQEFQHWQQIAGNSVVKIALAPERNDSLEFIQQMTRDGVLASIAHTDASFDCCVAGIDAGARDYVHLFNGMTGLHHREPGVVGAALTDERAFAELICDGHHVHPSVATFAANVKGNKLILITDCMSAGLQPDGKYMLGEFPVVMKDGIAKMENGSLAGSTLKLIDGVRNLHKWSNLPLHEVWHRASLSPAKSLRLNNKLGSIAKGKLADYIVLNNDLNVKSVTVEGETKWSGSPNTGISF
ncbi:N-acetylglucosamine-6-phosphate deacetylase [Virgibacillus sp. NKC19-3]|uniref:N-acetylglucosamine-6-phosphate deacetylase n=1 Tax=Virgibacillus saliphilus TaxID=2831674 RepID=UPI001C9AD97A|nr:N-acetylglucosamine-6-phosphate deacetylase [Virgibacillus sp. NKC19-3]MBY7144555.1 N-acetylglucosamine-6-phosphate deacetylase [Virgibacillus sp. NKC19-3]